MKLAYILPLLALIASANVQAASLKEIFQNIADTTENGNGNGHLVLKATGPFNEKREIAKILKALNKDNSGYNDCRYDVYADIEDGLKEINDSWSANKTASRLTGLADKGLIKQIIYSVWDPSTGDSEYCSIASIKVFAVDGTILDFDFNETD